MKRIYVAGYKTGRLTIVSRDGSIVNCLCDCGQTKTMPVASITGGKVRSCGCLLDEWRKSPKSHGRSKSRTYRIWCGIWHRCKNQNAPAYPLYGGRGIALCERWESFFNFISDMGDCPPRHTIERIDNNGNYEPSNCKWATRKEQQRNQRRTVLTEDDVRGIRQLQQQHLTARQIAQALDIPSIHAVRFVMSGKSWKDIL